MRRINAAVRAYFFEHANGNRTGRVDFLELFPKTKEAHSATFEPSVFEFPSTAENGRAVIVFNREPGSSAEIERQQHFEAPILFRPLSLQAVANNYKILLVEALSIKKYTAIHHATARDKGNTLTLIDLGP